MYLPKTNRKYAVGRMEMSDHLSLINQVRNSQSKKGNTRFNTYYHKIVIHSRLTKWTIYSINKRKVTRNQIKMTAKKKTIDEIETETNEWDNIAGEEAIKGEELFKTIHLKILTKKDLNLLFGLKNA